VRYTTLQRQGNDQVLVGPGESGALEEAAPRFGVEATSGGVHDADEIERAITSFVTHARVRNLNDKNKADHWRAMQGR
jgi:hypothetical protein